MTTTQSAADIIQSFYAQYSRRFFDKGQLIVLPSDDEVPPISYLEQGQVIQYDITRAGKKVIVNIFKPGAFFPVVSAVKSSLNHYYFEAATGSFVRQAPHQDVAALLQREPAATYDLLARVCSGIDGVLGKLALLLGETADARLLYELVIAAERFGIMTADGTRIDITEQDLSQQTGLARETVSRELKKLKTSGRVTTARGSVTLRDARHLAAEN